MDPLEERFVGRPEDHHRLLPSHRGVRFKELVEAHARFEALPQVGHRHAGASETPLTATTLRVRINGLVKCHGDFIVAANRREPDPASSTVPPMLARLSGTLVDVDPTANLGFVDAGQGLTYEVLLPAFVTMRLVPREGQELTLHTLHFLEGSSQGTTLFPRLAGFATREDKAFFELFVTVKGIGHRRALRAMVLPPATLAAAIADRDLKLIQTMPEVGKRLAETIVVTLKGKVDPWIGGSVTAEPRKPVKGELEREDDGAALPGGTLARDALEVLTQLGEPRTEALQSIERLLSADDAPSNVESLIAAVYAARK